MTNTDHNTPVQSDEWTQAVQQLATAEAALGGNEEAEHPAANLAALYDAREGLMACPAPNWAAVAVKAKLMGDIHEDDGWESADPETPWGRLALVVRTCLTLAAGPITPEHRLAAALFIEEMAKSFAEHREGYRAWACNPGHAVATLATYVDNLRADARALAPDGWRRALGVAWFDEGGAA